MSRRTLRFGSYSFEVGNLDKVLFPDCGVTKGELIDYYRDIADRMVPHLSGRPLTLHRFPDGIAEDGFYQQQASDYFPDWIDTVTVDKADGTVDHVVCENAATLGYLANQACIALHAWLARRDRLHHPDRLVFDLDPPEDGFELVRAAARQLRELLDDLGLVPYLLATGGKGLHVVVPLDRSSDFDAARNFARDVANLLAERESEKFTTATRKDQRKGRLFLDYLRNAYGQTAVAPFAVRARPGAPVAVPLHWDELDDSDLRGNRWSLRELPRRLAQLDDDPWQGMARRARSLGGPREKLDRLLDRQD